jgi:hypothetical protein
MPTKVAFAKLLQERPGIAPAFFLFESCCTTRLSYFFENWVGRGVLDFVIPACF